MMDAQQRSEFESLLRGFRKTLASVAVFSLVINLLLLVPSVYMLQVYDRVLPSRNETTLWMLTAMVLGLYALSAAIDYVRSLVAARVAQQVEAGIGPRVFDASMSRQLRQPMPHVTQPLNDLAALRQFIASPAVFAFFDAPWFPIYLAVIFLFNTWLGWFAVAGTLVLLLLAAANEWLTSAQQAKAGRATLRANQAAAGALRNAEAVQALGMREALYRRWRGLQDEGSAAQLRSADLAQAVAALSRFFKLALQSLVLGFGALLVLEGQMTAGMMIASSILMGRTLAPVEQLIAVWRHWGQAREAHGRLDSLLRQHPARRDGLALPPPQGAVAVEALSVAPPGREQPVLQDIRFSLAPGDVLGVVGASGSGKSSLARALVGVWEPLRGHVRLDGAELAHWPAQQRGAALGYLPQDVELLEGTVAENIARFQPDAAAADVVAAAQAAGVHELILRLPQGYETPLADRGVGLSGGQIQRIGLARALYGNPALVVLDEPNSNLDEAGERALQRCIQGLRERRATVVLVTHRPGVLTLANRLLTLHEGRQQLFGPRDEVIAALAKARQARPPAAPAQPQPALKDV